MEQTEEKLGDQNTNSTFFYPGTDYLMVSFKYLKFKF